MPLRDIKQTNNTILFEKFTDEQTDLITLMSNDWNETLFQRIEEKLVVTNFDDFLSRFAPVVYILAKDDNRPYFTTEKPANSQIKGIKLDQSNKIVKSLLRMLDAKANSNKSNIDFDYETFLLDLAPQKAYEEAKQISKEYVNKIQQYEKIDKENPDRNKLIKAIGQCRKQITKIYIDNPLNVLPYAIAQTEEQVKLLSANVSTEEGNSTPKLREPSLDDAGKMKSIAYESKNSDITDSVRVDKTKAIELIQNDYKKIVPVVQQSKYISDLVVSIFTGENISSRNEITLAEMNTRLSEFRIGYKQMQESFIEIAHEYIKKILGVKLFFDQGNGKEKDNPKLLIANASLEMLAKNKDRISAFFNNVNNTLAKKYWFAIAPNISIKADDSINNNEIYDDLDSFDVIEGVLGKSEEIKGALANLEILLNVCEKAKVMTFFNVTANEETGFESLSGKTIEGYINDLGHIESEYAVFSFPNFTLLPANKSLVEIGKDNVVDEFGDLSTRQIKLVLNGIYIDASYVAAGLVAAYQNPKNLEDRGMKVIKNNPAVRFNIEEGDNSSRFTSSLSGENLLNWTDDIKNVINEDRFGFSFCSDKIYLNGKAINNSFAYTARTLGKDNDKYKGIYKVLTRDFIFAYLRQLTGSKKSKIEDFIKKEIGREWNKKTESENDTEFANLILRKGDGLYLGEYDIDTKTQDIKLVFDNEEEIVEININE